MVPAGHQEGPVDSIDQVDVRAYTAETLRVICIGGHE